MRADGKQVPHLCVPRCARNGPQSLNAELAMTTIPTKEHEGRGRIIFSDGAALSSPMPTPIDDHKQIWEVEG